MNTLNSGPELPKEGAVNSPLLRIFASSWMRAAGLMLLALVVYWPCLRGPFVFDDNEWIIDLQWAYQNLDGLKKFWLVPGTSQQYYPLTATTFWIDYQLWGLNTLPYHLENVLLHGLSAVLFWRLLRQLGVRGAFFAAALFVAHPMMVESVSWITERRNVLCQALILAAGLAYGRSPHGWSAGAKSRSWYFAAFGLFTAAVLAKITAFVFPAALLVIAWWKHGRVEWRRDVLPVLPMFVISILAGLGIYWMETHHLGAEGSGFELSFLTRLMLSGQILWFYLGKMLWPHPVCIIYYRWPLDPSVWWQWLGTVATILAAAFLILKNRKGQWRGATAGALLFAGMLFPLLGFLNVAGMLYSWVADRWIYMPAIALFAGLGHAWDCLPIRSAAMRMALGALLVSMCGILSWQQAGTYGSADAFWQAAIAGNPNPWKARSDYSDMLITEGRLEEAVDQLQQAIQSNPESADVHCNLGVAYHSLGRLDQALASFQKASQLEPDAALLHYNMALVYQHQNRHEEMLGQFLRAVELAPDFLQAHNDLGNYFFGVGGLDDAEQHYRRTIALRPGEPHFLTMLGRVLFRKSRQREAIELYKEALAIDPNLISALGNYAFALVSTQDSSLRDMNHGIEMAARAAQLSNHQDVDILLILAKAQALGGNFLEAADAARTAAKVAEQQGNSPLASQLRQTAGAYAEGRVAPQ